MSTTAPLEASQNKNNNFQVKIIYTDERYDGDLYSQRQNDNNSIWNSEVTRQVSSQEWLKDNSLRVHRLDAKSVYPKLGFVHLEEFDPILKKPIRSRYGESLFVKYVRDDGKRMNIVANESVLKQLHNRLQSRLALLQQRFEWLTTSSRRMCGIIQERVVTVVFNITATLSKEFDQSLFLLERLLKEQISNIDRFNLISCLKGTPSFQQTTVPANKASINEAIDWLWSQKCSETTPFVDIGGVLRMSHHDTSNEAIYLFIEGDPSDKLRDELSWSISSLAAPLHIIHYNSSNSDMNRFLKQLCEKTGGKFHAYSVAMSIDNYEGMPINDETQRADIAVRSRLYGGIVPGSALREDCLLIFEEIESARQILAQVQYLIQQIPNVKMNYEGDGTNGSKLATSMNAVIKEDSMSSKQWLEVFGLKSRRLDFFDVLRGCIFKHCDGVVNIAHAPYDDPNQVDFNEQQDAIREPKLINAKYCDKFAHVRWKDDTIVHVHVTSDVYRLYEKQMQVALGALQRRLEMLKKGSREIFGTITEDQIYILIDASGSMEPSMTLVKDKLYVLLQEQLRFKKSVNFVAFNSKSFPWRDRLAGINEDNIKNAWQWIRTQRCSGSTNTLAALRFALSDPKTEGVYLLTDGRPDQPTRTILAHVQILRKVPIHTISFNCADKEANEFLLQLAQDSGGRFHVYHNTMFNSTFDTVDEHDQVKPWESEDIRLIKEEYQNALDSLARVGKLRDECFRLAWKKETHESSHNASANLMTHRHKKCIIPSGKIDNYDIADRCKKDTPLAKLDSKRSDSHRSSRSNTARRPLNRPKAKNTFRKQMEKQRAQSVDRADFIASMNNGETDSQNWMLPETKRLLESQDKRFEEVPDANSGQPSHPHANQSSTLDYLQHLQNNQTDRDIPLGDWLKLNTLKRKKLTIYDALGPCTLYASPRHDKVQQEHQIDVKTFEHVLPDRYFKERDCDENPLVITPLTVDWATYRHDLLKLIRKYEKRWVKVIQKSFTNEQISSLIGEPAEGLNFSKHGKVIKNIYKRFKKAIKEPAYPQLDKELKKGWKYYTKSLELEHIQQGDEPPTHEPPTMQQELNEDAPKHFFEEQESDSIAKMALSDDAISTDRNLQELRKALDIPPSPEVTNELDEKQSSRPNSSSSKGIVSADISSTNPISPPPLSPNPQAVPPLSDPKSIS